MIREHRFGVYITYVLVRIGPFTAIRFPAAASCFCGDIVANELLVCVCRNPAGPLFSKRQAERSKNISDIIGMAQLRASGSCRLLLPAQIAMSSVLERHYVGGLMN